MNVLIMGAAGSGKGTMSSKITSEYGINHISTGDMFRAAIKQQTPLGIEAQKYIDKGELVPDEITINMALDKVQNGNFENGYLLDGFPRTLPQAIAFDKMSKEVNKTIDIVISLNVNLEALADRITGRRICENCGSVYHIEYNPSKEDGICDKCAHKLYQRADDTYEGIKVRLDLYDNMTKPVLDYYRNLGDVVDIDATQNIEKVWYDIRQALENI